MRHGEKVTARTVLRLLGLAWLAGTGCAAPSSAGERGPQNDFGGIDTTLIRELTRVLSHDSLRGRGTGTPGTEAAARIIARACREAGLQPVGGDYLHGLPLTRIRIVPERTTLTLGGGAAPATFEYPAGFVFQASARGTMHAFSGQAVYVGTETSLREAERLPPLAGAVAVTLGTVSPVVAGRIAGAGAAGMVHLVPDSSQYQRLHRRRESRPWVLRDSAAATSLLYPLPSLVLGTAASTVIANAADPAAASWPRIDRTVQLMVGTEHADLDEHNVLCAVPGRSDPARDTAIVYTAHYDHLGTSSAAPTADSVYNGFSDNAAGVAMLVAIGKVLQARHDGPRHTVLLAFFAAEEAGLLGSDYFVHAPPWPLSRITAVINLDAGAPPAKPWSWRIAGGDSSALGRLAVDVAMRNGWSAVTSAATPNSDYYPFWRRDVPAIFIIPGPGKYEGISADSSDALRRRWDRYHQPDDEWAPDFPFEGLGRYAEYALQVGLAADGGS